MEISDLIPRNKFDFERVYELKKLDVKVLKPILPYLFEWIQDINWPIATEIAQILVECKEEGLPNIRLILKGDDYDWKYFCLTAVVKDLPKEIKKELTRDLERLTFNPSKDDVLFEIDIEAGIILSEIE
ncbi:DUF5071 domain-containing protein [Paenibacillus sp. FSL H7-0331]|uniref:DUF5071 domain-containing protein n=1 Tax=Paenibacillus sp. FSL H7-0331 TaxID=1920421 RepID=UPI00096E9511|nr:DUF5071 domain-containing protein [Paenibacillus sp. FSL H7-0331]OME97379.1 hypothetical protein BK127_40570 [Paenibacillus sp. FSL H7-0331]